MDRGCVCCSLRNDIVKALKDLQGRAGGRGVAHDAILLETTGLADPAPVAFTFFANSWISANYRLDSILCLVDAQHLREVRGSPLWGQPGGGRSMRIMRMAQAWRTPPPCFAAPAAAAATIAAAAYAASPGWPAGWLAGCVPPTLMPTYPASRQNQTAADHFPRPCLPLPPCPACSTWMTPPRGMSTRRSTRLPSPTSFCSTRSTWSAQRSCRWAAQCAAGREPAGGAGVPAVVWWAC
jgi:hypothetical protein